MFKRYSILLLFSLAYTLVLGHSVIPHDHHKNHSTEHHHHHGNDHDHKDDHSNSEKDLGHLFSHYQHTGDFVIRYSADLDVLKDKLVSALAVEIVAFVMEQQEPYVAQPPPYDNIFYLSPHALSSGLRAPPALI